jgi:hypothetical protein
MTFWISWKTNPSQIPSTDFYMNDLSCQHILERVHNDNDGGLAKKNVMT